MTESEELRALRAENARLVALLDAHGIGWRTPAEAAPAGDEQALRSLEPSRAVEPPQARLSTADKVALFARLFRGRTDVVPIRWEC